MVPSTPLYFWTTDLEVVEVESLMKAATLNILEGRSSHQGEVFFSVGAWVVLEPRVTGDLVNHMKPEVWEVVVDTTGLSLLLVLSVVLLNGL